MAVILGIPAFIIIALCFVVIKIESTGPAFFIQERPGLAGKIFKVYKHRTMRVETEKDGRKLSDMERMTKSGKIIRKLSLARVIIGTTQETQYLQGFLRTAI